LKDSNVSFWTDTLISLRRYLPEQQNELEETATWKESSGFEAAKQAVPKSYRTDC
jgi:hypothetical protein